MPGEPSPDASFSLPDGPPGAHCPAAFTHLFTRWWLSAVYTWVRWLDGDGCAVSV